MSGRVQARKVMDLTWIWKGGLQTKESGKGGQASGMFREGEGAGAGGLGGSKTEGGLSHAIRPQVALGQVCVVRAGGTASPQGSRNLEGPGQRPLEKLVEPSMQNCSADRVCFCPQCAGPDGSVTCSGLCCNFNPKLSPGRSTASPALHGGFLLLIWPWVREGGVTKLAILGLAEQMCGPDKCGEGGEREGREPPLELFVYLFSPPKSFRGVS